MTRATCQRCLRAQSACICAWIVPLQAQVEVVILQHPLEVQHTKNSARLAHLSLAGSRLLVGETFAVNDLQTLLSGDDKTSVLLYPPTENGTHPALPADFTGKLAANKIRLIVLDGTWRKSRKMLYCNPLLQQLPRLSLHTLPASHYRIRKAHQPDQVSTLEAICHALAQLEQDESKYMPLLTAFDGFIAQLAQYWDRQ